MPEVILRTEDACGTIRNRKAKDGVDIDDVCVAMEQEVVYRQAIRAWVLVDGEEYEYMEA